MAAAAAGGGGVGRGGPLRQRRRETCRAAGTFAAWCYVEGMAEIKDMLDKAMVIRADGRVVDELRPVRITRHFTDVPEGSVLIECGNTRVMCTATFTPSVPRWRKDSGLGWGNAEYSMLPRAQPSSCAARSAAAPMRSAV